MPVSTRPRNRHVHPAAPVMTDAARERAGIQPKRRSRRITKNETIRRLQAQIHTLENLDGESFSNEPLFLEGPSPPSDGEDATMEDASMEDANMEDDMPADVPTEVESDDDGPSRRKRHDPRALRRTKAFNNLQQDVRPTVRNKPSGLKRGWLRTVSGSSVQSRSSLPSASPMRSRSSTPSTSSMQSRSSTPSTPTWSSSSSTLVSPTPAGSLMARSSSSLTLVSSSPSSLPLTSPIVSRSPLSESFDPIQEQIHPPAPLVLPRTVKDKQGRRQQPGLRDLPSQLRSDFRNRFIRHIIQLVCLSATPWSNPTLPILQQEFNSVYPALQYRLHSDDAAVVPTLRDMGVLRNQIGSEGLAAVIEYLPEQCTKRGLNSKDSRAKYVAALLTDSQRPFIWVLFRPATIPLSGTDGYYDQKRKGAFQSEPVLRAFSIFFTSYGIQLPIPSTDPGDGHRPIGVLALAATAVERGYHMHSTGDYVPNGSDFSSSKWNHITEFYVDKIKHDLTSENWTAIFQALHRLDESDMQQDRIQAGAPLIPEQREALLPDDPPTPPPSV